MNKSITKIVSTIPQGASFYISHMGDKRGRLYSGSADMSHMSGKDAKLATVFAPAAFDIVQELNNIGKFMDSRNGKPMEKWGFAERMADVEPRLSEIIAHANDPIGAVAAIKGYDEPKRYMQAAIAIAKGMESGESGTVSASDGSCSGLQHLNGGMVKDHAGAGVVNLTSQDARSDIYEIVRDYVVANWSPEGDSEEAIELASKWVSEGAVTRKVVKKSVMTLTYGSSDGSVRSDVRDQLVASGWVDLEDPIHLLASTLIGNAVVHGRKANAGRAMGAMAFLKKVVKAVFAFTDGEQVVKWDTGNGVFHNRRVMMDNESTSTFFNGVETAVKRGVESDTLDLSGMTKAIAPNFVHSYDAAHLQNVVLACSAKGIPLIVIHDSFNSTPNNYVAMNKIIRQEFVSLYKGKSPLREMLDFNQSNMSVADYAALVEELTNEVMVDDYNVDEIIGNEFAFA